MALSRSQRNALRASSGKSTRGKVSSAPVSSTGVTGTTYKANQPTMKKTPTDNTGTVNEDLANKVQDINKVEAKQPTPTMVQPQEQVKEQTPNYGAEAVTQISDYIKRMGQMNTQNIEDTNKMYDAKREADLSALRNAIAKQTSGYQQTLSQSREKFQPAREAVDVRRARDLQRIRELQGAQGVFGGDNITAQTGINTQASADIGALDRQQANYESDLMRTIADLQSAGSESERQIITQNLADRIQATMANRQSDMQNRASANQQLLSALGMAQRSGEFDYNRQMKEEALARELDRIGRQDYQTSITGLGQQMDYQQEINNILRDNDPTNDWKVPMLQQERERKIQGIVADEVSTIGQYSDDYDAEIERRLATDTDVDDELIPYLELAKEQQLAQQQQDESEQATAEKEAALALWKQTGIANDYIASKIDGVNVGDKTSDRSYKDAQTEINRIKAESDRIRANTAANKETRLGTQKEDRETVTSNTKYKLNDSDKAVYRNLVEESSDAMTGLIDKNVAITRIKALIDEGYNMDAVEKMAEQLGISESDIAEYVSSQQSQTQFNPSVGQFPLRIN